MRVKEEIAAQMVNAILAELTSRSGFENAWDDTDDDIKEEIRTALLHTVIEALDRYKVNIV